MLDLGWKEVEVIDDDLGRTASGTVARLGFERMVSEVCMGQVGAVAGRSIHNIAHDFVMTRTKAILTLP